MKTVNIDCYGHRLDTESDRFQNPRYEKYAHLVDKTTDGITYIAFSRGDGDQAIHRVQTADGVTTITWAWGKWADRASLTYDMTLNETTDIQVAE